FQAGVITGLSNPGFILAAETVIILGLITLLVVEIPFIIYLIFSSRVRNRLDPARNWIINYGDYLTTIVYLFLGFLFIIRGFMFI
ncbi:MAG TPA: GAP family protein, partial [Methanobacterium sp.]|nr:GAP family protein [Methanobacterium sp.]